MATALSPVPADDEEEKGQIIEATCARCHISFKVPFHRFKDIRYTSWIKASLCLQETKEGLEGFVENTSKEMYDDVKALISDARNCEKKCTLMQFRKLSFTCNTCKSLKTKLTTSCSSGNPTWKNTTLEKLEHSHHDVAKLFMPTQCEMYTGPKEGDCTAILSFMGECVTSTSKIQNPGVIDAVRQSRNEIMHSGTMRIDETQLTQHSNRCITLLSDAKYLAKDESCMKAIEEIVKITGHKMHVDLVDAEKKVMGEHSKHVNSELVALKQQIESPECTKEELNEAKTKIKKLEENEAQKQVITEFYNVDAKEIADLKKEASELYLQAEKKKDQLVTTELKEKDDKVSDLTKDLDKEKDRIKVLQKNLDDEKQQTKDLEKQIQETARKKKMEEEMKAQYEKTLKDIIQHVAERYQGTYKCFPVHIAKPTFKGSVIDMYVKQSMEVVSHGRYRTERQKKVRNFADIFYTDENVCHDIIISGGPGVGKTTFCKRLASVWSDNCSNSHETKMSTDEREMQRFKLLFYISLNGLKIKTELRNTDDLVALIQNQLDLKGSDIKDVLSKEQCIILLDSMSEFISTQLIRTGLHRKSVIIQTSRSGGNEYYEGWLDNETVKEIEIKGIAKDSESELVEKIMRCLDTELHSDKTSHEFMQKMEEIGINQLLNIPMILVQLACLWHEDTSFDKSQYGLYSTMIHNQLLAAAKSNAIPDYNAPSKTDFPLCCNIKRCVCRRYGELFWKVSKLAYDTLLSEERIVSLGFDESQLKLHNLSTEEIDICLKSGIMTQETLPSRYTFHFPHTTHQEFFASVFLCKTKQAVQFKTLFAPEEYTLDRVLEMEKILLFSSELEITIARQFSGVLMEKAADDCRVQEYRESCERRWNAPNAELIKKIQTAILTAGRQASGLVLHDVRAYRSNLDELANVDLGIVKSLFISSSAIDTLNRLLTPCRSLQKIVLNGCKMRGIELREIISTNRQSLKALGLYGNGIDLLSLGNNVVEDLSLKRLVSLGLGGLKLTHEQIQLVFFQLVQLKEVQFRSLRCSQHGLSAEKCDSKLNLSGNTNLIKLTLWKLPASVVMFESTQLKECVIKLDDVSAQLTTVGCLKTAQNLQLLECIGIWNPIVLGELLEVLPQLRMLRKLVLQYIDFCDSKRLCLSHEAKSLETVEIYEFVIPGKCLLSLVDSLPSNRVKVMLYSGKINSKENVFCEIRQEHNVSLIDDVVYYKSGMWEVEKFVFLTRK